MDRVSRVYREQPENRGGPRLDGGKIDRASLDRDREAAKAADPQRSNGPVGVDRYNVVRRWQRDSKGSDPALLLDRQCQPSVLRGALRLRLGESKVGKITRPRG